MYRVHSYAATPPNVPRSSFLPSIYLVAMSTIMRPFGVNPGGRYHGRRHGRFALRPSSAEGENGEKEVQSTERKKKKKALEVLYDDGFGSVTMKDYLEAVRAMPKDDGGPPRWFCPVECGRPEVDRAPLLLFLPGSSK